MALSDHVDVPRFDALPSGTAASPPHLRLLEPVASGDTTMEVEASNLFASALARTAGAALQSPVQLTTAVGALFSGVAEATLASVGRATGRAVEGPMPCGRDARFADPTWTENAGYYLLRQYHLLGRRFLDDVIEAAPIDERTRRKAAVAAGLVSDTLAPTNVLLGNPAALHRAFQTGGLSLVRGARNMVHDVATNEGFPSQVDRTPFTVGENLACTPGKVVFRSELMEVLQYEPTTEQVHEIPLLFCPPWINKYYIMDLSPGRSLVEWAVAHGHTCFAISYCNPDASRREVSFDDYLPDGPLKAIEVVKQITGSDVVNTLAVCLGGTLSVMGMAHDAAHGTQSVNAATLINTHTDFTRPGVLGTFADPATIDLLDRHMARAGSLNSRRIARTFSLIRANDLVFSYLVKNWLMGETPPAFDLLAWNDDGTDMPPRMHMDFLRWFYVENRLAEGRLEVAGTTLDPRAVRQPTYIVSAVEDHIVPWASAYQTSQLLGGDDNRFVLSTSGHIAAIVNPPSPKAKHWTNTELPPDHDAWLGSAELHEGTWWEDWSTWIADRAGPMVDAPDRLGSDQHPPIGEAPGIYVLG
jgi:polyhydroxyalkanoate synthase subunit PhaC